jgi:hypothetical protein
MLDDRCRRAIETAEAYADGLTTFDKMEAASFGAEDASNEAYERGDGDLCCARGAAIFAAQGMGIQQLQDGLPSIFANLVASADEVGLDDIAELLREHRGNPFCPVSLDARWLTPTVVALAKTIYSDRAFDRLPILADALEESGCTKAEILDHCRGPGPHVRGCWAVDLILGKE